MTHLVDKAGLKVDGFLASFIDDRALPGSGLSTDTFWDGFAKIYQQFTGPNRALLHTRDKLQSEINAWHSANPGPVHQAAYQSFLSDIGYIRPEPAPFTVSSSNVDDEVAKLAGPQLVVPATNARFVLNAANARWGSLYDALYGTDVVPGVPAARGYDAARGAAVIARAKAFLDDAFSLEEGRWADARGFQIIDGQLSIADANGLSDAKAFVGYRGPPRNPTAILLRHHGLHVELVIDRTHAIGKDDPAGIADVVLEAALSTIIDFEDSVAVVDGEDKTKAYENWLGLMKGDLTATFDKGERAMTRRLAEDRRYTAAGGGELMLPGRSLLFARNVGHLMTTPAILLPDGSEGFEGILDGVVTSLIALHDLRRTGATINSRAGSIYIVKPKMHGPDEAAFTNQLFDAIEKLFGLPQSTIKIGLMDEERRTSANLAACIAALKTRLVFINTGFLDRTGDEIHTSMRAGAMVPKGQIRHSAWIKAYEDRNVQIGLASGLSGRAQIGKGMWAAPDRMADMLDQKISHPMSGANTAWVPSPTAATLHAMHYHKVDVFARQAERKAEPVAALETLLTIPLAGSRNWSAQEITDELDNNVQGILGYVVRWIDQGVGCSKVPDIHDVGLMEDRATLRISSQHITNWLLHGVVTAAEVDAAFARMARKVDAQNRNDPVYQPMAGRETTSLAYQAARALVFEGVEQPNGYTEPLLHGFRARAKKQQAG
ncbi:MAG: malate synthase G [Hyphomonadaceae bacterium]